MFRLVLLLLAFAALALFVFQNISPVLPLVVLGIPTIALPVGLWVLGAIAAGAFTSILIAALIRLAAPRSSRSGSRRPAPAASTSDGKGPSPSQSGWKASNWVSDWAGVQDKQTATAQTNRSPAKRGAAGDWEQPAQRDDWDDWEVASPAATASPPPQTSPFTTASFVEENPFRLPEEEPIYQEMPYEELADQEREVWDDWEEEEARREEPPPPQRDFVEIRRTPQTQSRSGTVYSYTYRTEDREPAKEQVPSPPSDGVVDADFRVITPPYRPAAAAPETSDDELEEWDDWEYEPEKPADEPEKSYQNPPLNLGNHPRQDGE